MQRLFTSGPFSTNGETMQQLAKIFRTAREAAHLTIPMMAALAGLEPSDLEALEQARRPISPDLLDRYARVFGLSLERFMNGEAATAPVTILFRSMYQSGPGLQELAQSESHLVLGDFLRCVHDMASLQALLNIRPARTWADNELPAPPRPDLSVYQEAEEMAARARELLELGRDPIASMIQLVEGLGIALFWVGPDALDPGIDGASTVAPIPAILVNLVEGAETWWRTRMTLAHELCHLFFDRGVLEPARNRFFLFSPHLSRSGRGVSQRWRLFEQFEQIERRANAFAAYFLAPRQSVKEATADLDVTSEAAIECLCQTFFVGRITAINHLTNIYGLSPETRLKMLERCPSARLPSAFPDRVTAQPGLRGGRLQTLALEAFSRGLLDKVSVRAFLSLPLTEPLPGDAGLTPEQRRPLRPIEDLVRQRAEQYLRKDLEDPFVQTGRVSREAGGWQVEVLRWGPTEAGPSPKGLLMLSHELEFRSRRYE